MGPGSDTSLKGFFPDYGYKTRSMVLWSTPCTFSKIVLCVNRYIIYLSDLYKIEETGRDEGGEDIFSERRIRFMGCIF
jgi:hypothetical protein